LFDEALAESQAAYAEPIVFRQAILFDVAARLERREQSEDVVLVKLETLAELGHAKLVRLASELLENVQRMRD
jgi:hypothetical protein